MHFKHAGAAPLPSPAPALAIWPLSAVAGGAKGRKEPLPVRAPAVSYPETWGGGQLGPHGRGAPFTYPCPSKAWQLSPVAAEQVCSGFSQFWEL